MAEAIYANLRFFQKLYQTQAYIIQNIMKLEDGNNLESEGYYYTFDFQKISQLKMHNT